MAMSMMNSQILMISQKTQKSRYVSPERNIFSSNEKIH